MYLPDEFDPDTFEFPSPGPRAVAERNARRLGLSLADYVRLSCRAVTVHPTSPLWTTHLQRQVEVCLSIFADYQAVLHGELPRTALARVEWFLKQEYITELNVRHAGAQAYYGPRLGETDAQQEALDA